MPDSQELSRRRLLGAGIGAAGTLLIGSRISLAQTTQKADDICCGIIGAGLRGTGIITAINASPGVRVTAICDINKTRLNDAAKVVEADKPNLFTDYRALIDCSELDAVFVETPAYLHKEMVIAVLESDRHCYGEKPMAIRVSDLNKMVKAAKRSRGIYQVGTQLRYAAPWKPAIEAVHQGAIGKPIMIRAHRHTASDIQHDHTWYFSRDESSDTICELPV